MTQGGRTILDLRMGPTWGKFSWKLQPIYQCLMRLSSILRFSLPATRGSLQSTHFRMSNGILAMFQPPNLYIRADMVRALLCDATSIVSDITIGKCVLLRVSLPLFSPLMFKNAGTINFLADASLACLVNVLLDKECRTIVGFCQLLRKEWFGEGYAFGLHQILTLQRTYGLPSKKPNIVEPKPQFLRLDQSFTSRFYLFVHALSEIFYRYPSEFQWNELFLNHILRIPESLVSIPFHLALTVKATSSERHGNLGNTVSTLSHLIWCSIYWYEGMEKI